MTIALDTSIIIFGIGALVSITIWLIRLENKLELLKKDLHYLKQEMTQSGNCDQLQLQRIENRLLDHWGIMQRLADYINEYMAENDRKLFIFRKYD